MLDDEDDDEEPSYAEEADALLDQMRQLRESMQQESGILRRHALVLIRVRLLLQNLGRTVASIVDDVANMPSLMVDVANGRWADAELQPPPAAIGGARSGGAPPVASGADGPSDADSRIEAELARRRAMDGAAHQVHLPSGHGASVSPPLARPSPPALPQPGAAAKGGKAPRFATKPGGAAAARAEHISKVRGAPAVQGTVGAASDISRLASRPLLPPPEPLGPAGTAGAAPAPRAKGAPRRPPPL